MLPITNLTFLDVTVKQADVILLGWPLEMEMSEAVRRNDLEFYAKVCNAISF